MSKYHKCDWRKTTWLMFTVQTSDFIKQIIIHCLSLSCFTNLHTVYFISSAGNNGIFLK